MKLPLNRIFVLITAVLTVGCKSARADEVGYFRFENLEKDKPVIAVDSYKSGNEFRAFNDGATPAVSSDVPFTKVPQTGAANQTSLDFTQQPGRFMQARDLFLIGSNDHLNPNVDKLEKWTLQISVKFARAEGFPRMFQTFIGREGYNITSSDALHENPLGCLGFKKRGDRNHFSIEAWDSANNYVVVESPDEVEPEVWYSLAATSDGENLTLWVKGPKDETYQSKGSKPFKGPLKNNRGLWTIGRGFFSNQISERFVGWLDEVKISADVLPVDQLIATPSNKTTAIVLAKKPPAEPLPIGDFGSSKPVPDWVVRPHDPKMIQEGDEYHIFATHNGINHFVSTDLIHWQESQNVFPTRPEWITKEIPGRLGFWAPDISYFNGKYHLYYSASTWGSKRSLIGLVTTDSLISKDGKYDWKDDGKIIESFTESPFNAIDPSVLVTPEGKVWISWGSFNRGIYLSEIDPATGKLKDSKQITHIADRPGNTAIEGPELFYRDGWYYLFASFDRCCTGAASTYKILVSRAKEITGPYVDRDGKPMLEGNASLVVRSYDYLRGPGQCSFVESRGQLLMAHHFYDGRQFGAVSLAVRPVYFDDQGWPLVGEPINETTATTQPQDSTGLWLGLTDDISPENFNLSPDGTAKRGSVTGTWKIDQQRITITWNQNKLTENGFLSKDHHSYVARRSDGAITRAVKISAP